MPRRASPSTPLWNANQIVALNVAKARALRGWTQEEAADALAPYLGVRMSGASFSAIERSVDRGRPREFSANEILAFARGFRVPIAWFFTPPTIFEQRGISTPDADEEAGLDPMVMLDAVLGTPETLADYKEYLLGWPIPGRLRVHADGRIEDLGPKHEDIHPRVDDWLRLRARMLLRSQLGDVDRAKAVLAALGEVLDELDDGATE